MMSQTDHQKNIFIPDDLPYRIASTVLGQGVKCDALARRIRQTLPEYLHKLGELAQADYEMWEGAFPVPQRTINQQIAEGEQFNADNEVIIEADQRTD
jgi:hypothetical protein